MIKFIHRNKRFITVVFAFIAVCFMITGVGVDILHNGANPNRDLIEVNGQELSAEDLGRSEQGVESRYRQMFGENFARFASSLNINIRQQAIDSLIDRTVLDQEASKLGFAASDDAVREYLLTTFFKGENGETSFSPATYRNLLQSIGMSAPQFEQEIKDEIARTTLVNILRDVAVPTQKDAEGLLKRQKTKYSVVAATLTASEATVPAPSEMDLKKYYESHATEYELPAQVSYSYITFPPIEFEKEVQITPQDVEFFYSENAARYTTPEQTRARGIKLLYPKESDPQKMAAVREKATKAREEALSGKPFTDLVTKYSDDLPAKLAGGDMGWVGKGGLDEKLDAAVAKTEVGAVTEIIETDYGFEIIKVEEKRPSRQRPLEEVLTEVEKELKAQEAPSYAANRAREIVEKARKGNTPLAQAAQGYGITLKETELLNETKDPESSVEGLTRQVFILPTSERALPSVVELGDSSVIVQVKEFKEPTLPVFDAVKERVTTAYKSQEAKRVAAAKGAELLAAAQANGTDLAKEATSRGATVVGPLTISREKSSVDKLPSLSAEMRNAIFGAPKADTVLGKVFASNGADVVIKVTAITPPNMADPAVASSLAKYKEQATQEVAQSVTGSTLAMLKARADIEVDPSLLSQ